MRTKPAANLLVALLLALLLAPLGPAQAADGLAVVSDTALTDRLHEIVVRSPAMERETTLRVLLPTGYDPAADVDYPVLYLLHGCCDNYRSWSDKTDLAELTAAMDLVVVMPDAGNGGWYTDWYRGTPRWESYHIGELIGWVEATYDVLPAREGRAVAGLSMGGFGAMTYAARHPDLFVAAAAFSGAVDTNIDASGAITDAIAGLDGGKPGDVFGPKATEEVRWRGHNPVDLAENLSTVKVELRTGNGMTDGGVDPVERYCWQQMTSLHDRLASLEQPHVWEDYGPGGHTWDLWQRDLHRTLPRFMKLFADPPPAPRLFAYRSIDPSYEVFGWSVELERAVLEFSRLDVRSRKRFLISGTGSGVVTTPAQYRPGVAYTASYGDVSEVVTADAAGRLAIPVDLGAANTFQQYTVPATATSVTRTADVQITRA